jgi:hypothetical protein
MDILLETLFTPTVSLQKIKENKPHFSYLIIAGSGWLSFMIGTSIMFRISLSLLNIVSVFLISFILIVIACSANAMWIHFFSEDRKSVV